MNKREVWTRGEVAALSYLEAKGYRVLAKNFACPIGEIDLVMQDGDVVVFVEVKARETLAYGEPIEAVTPQKVRKIATTAQRFLVKNRMLGRSVRFDVVEVYGEPGMSGKAEVDHIERVALFASASRFVNWAE